MGHFASFSAKDPDNPDTHIYALTDDGGGTFNIGATKGDLKTGTSALYIYLFRLQFSATTHCVLVSLMRWCVAVPGRLVVWRTCSAWVPTSEDSHSSWCSRVLDAVVCPRRAARGEEDVLGWVPTGEGRHPS
jgi:hypothetical protein